MGSFGKTGPVSDSPQGPGWWQASDGKWYPPQDPAPAPPPPSNLPPPGYLPPPQPGYLGQPMAPVSTGMSGCLKGGLIAGGILLVLGLGSCVVLAVAIDDAADEIDEAINEDNEREARDVSEPTCRADETTGFMEAELTVRNRSSERSNYSIEVTFEGPDRSQLDTAFLFVNALEPGQSTTDDAVTFTEAPDDFTCRVIAVERFSDEN